MNAIIEQKPALNHDDIANLARQIWQSEGGQEGRDLEYWLKAERQILAAKQQTSRQMNDAVAKRNASSATGKKTRKNSL
jgi:hypothetical protein